MTSEEFERIKAQEKAHLREIQRLKSLHKEATLTGKITQAFRSVFPSTEASATYDEMMGKLQRETAEAEARLDMAREAHAPTEIPPLPGEEAALAAARARQFVEDMKRTGTPPAPSDIEVSRTLGRTPAPESPPATTSSLPPRTIGRPS